MYLVKGAKHEDQRSKPIVIHGSYTSKTWVGKVDK